MSDDRLGFWGAVSIGLGGMIGGGVFSVLGVVATVAGTASWLAFTTASLVSLCAAYSYIALNEIGDRHGGSVTQIQSFTGRGQAAGMVGWTLLFGYVGAIAMYAYAFGGFALELVPAGAGSGIGVPLRPLLSIVAVALFVALNIAGARATGASEMALVAAKVTILLGVSAWGLWYGAQGGQLEFGLAQFDGMGLLTATAISFVSFQGWQLLMYDYDSVQNAAENIPRAIYVSIAGAIVVDSMVAILVTSLVETSVIQQHPEIAVARAVEPFLGNLGFVFIAVAALFSTGSAINGTLFSAAHFGKGLLSEGLAPDRLGDGDADGVPERTVIVLGGIAAVFTAYGPLEAITSFESLAFMAVFGTMSWLAFTQRDHDAVNPVVPAVGVIGVVAFAPLLLSRLYTEQQAVFWSVFALSGAVIAVELLYFEREVIADDVEAFEEDVAGALFD